MDIQEKSQNSKQSDNNLDLGILAIEDIYKLAREFAKAKEGTKAINLSYDDRNMINVLSKQVHYGKYDETKNKVGFLDLIGKDRVQLWKSLGDISKEEAMKKYIDLIIKVCPLFYAHLEAHKRHLEEEQKRLKLIEEDRKNKEMSEQKEKKLKEEDLKLLEENKKKREEIQKKQIQEALNQQTYPHFKAYAEQQHPNSSQAQEDLIKQLQEQHFEQYMNQVYQQQLLHQQQQAEQLKALRKAHRKQEEYEDQFKKISLINKKLNHLEHSNQNNLLTQENNNENKTFATSTSLNVISHDYVNLNLVSENNEHTALNATLDDEKNINKPKPNINTEQVAQKDIDNDEDDEIELPPLSAASMLTRKDIKEFKESVRRDNDAIIKVGSGETVTVRVPTHEDGRLIFWEFATDYYDLGFGLYFEWTISPSNNVTVHVSDSSEDEEGEEEEGKQDIEKGDKRNENKPPCDEIIPIFRRDCHEEVYAGSHLYPGRGVYLLKFDNSYSLWRSKTLYYRVYYSK